MKFGIPEEPRSEKVVMVVEENFAGGLRLTRGLDSKVFFEDGGSGDELVAFFLGFRKACPHLVDLRFGSCFASRRGFAEGEKLALRLFPKTPTEQASI